MLHNLHRVVTTALCALSREATNVEKRLLIVGQGALGEARLDQRANAPALRLTRPCVVRNLDIDMTGFREGLLVDGPAALQPLIDSCIIR